MGSVPRARAATRVCRREHVPSAVDRDTQFRRRARDAEQCVTFVHVALLPRPCSTGGIGRDDHLPFIADRDAQRAQRARDAAQAKSDNIARRVGLIRLRADLRERPRARASGRFGRADDAPEPIDADAQRRRRTGNRVEFGVGRRVVDQGWRGPAHERRRPRGVRDAEQATHEQESHEGREAVMHRMPPPARVLAPQAGTTIIGSQIHNQFTQLATISRVCRNDSGSSESPPGDSPNHRSVIIAVDRVAWAMRVVMSERNDSSPDGIRLAGAILSAHGCPRTAA